MRKGERAIKREGEGGREGKREEREIGGEGGSEGARERGREGGRRGRETKRVLGEMREKRAV